MIKIGANQRIKAQPDVTPKISKKFPLISKIPAELFHTKD